MTQLPDLLDYGMSAHGIPRINERVTYPQHRYTQYTHRILKMDQIEPNYIRSNNLHINEIVNLWRQEV